MDDTAKKAEKRGYANGYAAGRKRTEEEDQKWMKVHEEIQSARMSRRDAVFCAALTGLIQNGGWTLRGKPAKTMNEYIELAEEFAYAAISRLK